MIRSKSGQQSRETAGMPSTIKVTTCITRVSMDTKQNNTQDSNSLHNPWVVR